MCQAKKWGLVKENGSRTIFFKDDQRHFYRCVLFIPSRVIGEKEQKGGRTETGSYLGKTEEMGHCPKQGGQEWRV